MKSAPFRSRCIEHRACKPSPQRLQYLGTITSNFMQTARLIWTHPSNFINGKLVDRQEKMGNASPHPLFRNAIKTKDHRLASSKACSICGQQQERALYQLVHPNVNEHVMIEIVHVHTLRVSNSFSMATIYNR